MQKSDLSEKCAPLASERRKSVFFYSFKNKKRRKNQAVKNI